MNSDMHRNPALDPNSPANRPYFKLLTCLSLSEDTKLFDNHNFARHLRRHDRRPVDEVATDVGMVNNGVGRRSRITSD